MSGRRTFICIRCPWGCETVATVEGGKVTDVEGHRCDKGVEYVREEVEAPMRVLTTTVRVRGGRYPVTSVRTEGLIPRGKLEEAMSELATVVIDAPAHTGDVVSMDVAGTGVQVVVTRDVATG